MSAFFPPEGGEGTCRVRSIGKWPNITLPRKAQKGVIQLFVPESDTGRPPENGKAIEITLVKELGKIAS